MCISTKVLSNDENIPDEIVQDCADWLASNEQAYKEAKEFCEKYDRKTAFLEKYRF